VSNKNFATIYSDGRLSISTDLYENMGNPLAAELFVDQKNKLIGLKSSIQDTDAYLFKTNRTIRVKKIFWTMGYENVPNGRKNAKWDNDLEMVIIEIDNDI